jgi:hypothetical protein
MNIWHTIVAAVLIFVGLAQPVIPPQTTIVDIQPSGQVSSTTTPEQPAIPPATPKVIVEIPMPSPATQTAPAATTTETTPIPQTPTAPPPPVYVPIYIIQQPAPTPVPTVEPITQTQPTSMKSITIISPIATKGLGREYLSRAEIKDEFNYIELGLVVRDDADKVVKNVEVVITATDESQNKTLSNTGNVTPIYVDGVKIITPFYPFSYAFKTPGEHIITFVAEGLTQSVTLTVAEDTRP